MKIAKIKKYSTIMEEIKHIFPAAKPLSTYNIKDRKIEYFCNKRNDFVVEKPSTKVSKGRDTIYVLNDRIIWKSLFFWYEYKLR